MYSVCIYSTLLKVASYYDFSVLFMSDGFKKKLGGWGELYPSLFWIFGICLTLQSPFSSCRGPLLADRHFRPFKLQHIYCSRCCLLGCFTVLSSLSPWSSVSAQGLQHSWAMNVANQLSQNSGIPVNWNLLVKTGPQTQFANRKT